MSANAVWKSYVENSGCPPPNAFKLIVYSRRCTSLKTLTFDEANHLMDIHNNPSKSSKNNNKSKKKSNKTKLNISSNKSIKKSKSNSKKKLSHKNTNKNKSKTIRSHSTTNKSKKQSIKKKLNKHSNEPQQHLSTNYRSRSKSKSKTKPQLNNRSKSTPGLKTNHNNQRVSLKQKHKQSHRLATVKKQKPNLKTDHSPCKKRKDKIRSKSISVHRTKPKQNSNEKHVLKPIKSFKRKHRKDKIRANSTANIHKNKLKLLKHKSVDTDPSHSNKKKHKNDKLLPNNPPKMNGALSIDSYNTNKANSICIYDENNNETKQMKFRKKSKDQKRVKSLWTYDKLKGNDNISNKKQIKFKKKKKDKIRAKSVCEYNGDFDCDEEKQSINTFFNAQKKVQRKRSSPFNPKDLQKISAAEIKENLVEPAPVQMGDAVLLTEHREGIVKYIGNVHFADGIWFGIELCNGAVGVHDGIIDKQRYFKSPPYRGIFVQGNEIRRKVRHRDYHSSPKLRRRASLEQIARIKDIEFGRMSGINELDNVTIDVLDSDECFIVKEGPFKKMDVTNKGFKTRWFKLYTHKKMKYFEINSYSNGPNGKEKGCVELRKVVTINKKKGNIIEMETKGRKWVFKYSTCNDRDEWYDLLKQMCDEDTKENAKQNKKRKRYKYRKKSKNTSLPFNLVIGTPVHVSNATFDVDYV